MAQVLRANQQQSYGSRLGEALGLGVSKGITNYMDEKKQERLLEKKFEQKQGEMQQKQMTEMQPYITALETIQRMKQLGETGDLGIGSATRGLFSSNTRKARGAYEQAGKSLIQIASSLPIRNKAEFEVMAHKLYDPSLSDATREGILNELEQQIMSAMALKGGLSESLFTQNKPVGTEGTKERPPIGSFGG